LSADDLAQATRHAARAKPVVAAGTQSLVVFRVGAEWLALPTAIIREIAGARPIHALPHRRDGVVLGLANIRDRLAQAYGEEQRFEIQDAPDGGFAVVIELPFEKRAAAMPTTLPAPRLAAAG